MDKKKLEQFIETHGVALEWAALCFIVLELIGMFYTPTIGAIGILLGVVFASALFIGLSVHFLRRSDIAFWKVFVLKYVIAVICASIVWWFWWDKLVAIFPNQLLTQFDAVAISAQVDDRDAFDQLRNWAQKTSFPYQQKAREISEKILIDSEQFFKSNVPAVNVPWTVDPNKLTLLQLWDTFKSEPKLYRFGIIQYLWEQRKDISRKERLQFLVDVFKNEKSLEVLKLAGHYFNEDTNDKLVPLAYIDHLEWWDKHKQEIK